MKHFSFVYFSMLLHDSEEGCSHFVLEERISHGGPSPRRGTAPFPDRDICFFFQFVVSLLGFQIKRDAIRQRNP